MFARIAVVEDVAGTIEVTCRGCLKHARLINARAIAVVHEFDLRGRHAGTSYL
jgi:hypothetical protein